MSIYSIFFALLLGGASTVYAQTERLNVKDTSPVATSSLKASENLKTSFYGHIRTEAMQYFTPVPEQPQLTYSQLLSARLSGIKETSYIDFAGDVSGGTFFAAGQTHVVVHEAYLASHGNKPFKAYAGRKKMEWSDLDHRWALGLWQPTFAIDALRPEEQGLSGFFFDYNTENFGVMAFVSPLFIPNMGPDVREEGGGLVYDSRWRRSPSRDYSFADRNNNIQYDIEVPPIGDLINNGGGGLKMRAGNKGEGPWAVLSAGYLPVNELVLRRQNFKVVSADEVDVTVSPEVTHHAIYSADVGYTFENGVRTTVSFLGDDPQEKAAQEDWYIQKFNPIRAYSAALDFTLDGFLFFTRTLAFQVQYLKVDGGDIIDMQSDGQPADFTMFDQRLNYTNALSFGVEGQLASIYRRPLVTRFKYLYDYDQRGSVMNTEFLYYPSRHWAVLVGGDVLGVRDENWNPDRFINQFRANDRIYGGLTYVF